MTDPNRTAIAILVDRSGSMQGIKSDAEGALRSFIENQKANIGECTVRLSEFDIEYNVVYPSTPIKDAPDYILRPRGATALRDGIGRLVTEFGQELASLAEEKRPGKVIFIIQTDGYENASREWSDHQIKALITEQQSKWSWEFVYLGAGQDAIAVGQGMGITADSCLTYAATSNSVLAAGASLSSYVTRSRYAGAGKVASFTEEEREEVISH